MNEVFAKIKDNRPLLLTILGFGVLLILMSVTLINQNQTKKELEGKQEELTSALSETNRKVTEKQAELDAQKNASVKEVTGLDPNLIETDTSEAEKYFEPAFSWTSGEEYDKVRSDYIASLGKENTFTKTYLPADTKIETNDGKLSYIDFKKLRATMGNIHIVPITSEANRIRYVAFVTYYMHQTDNDLADTSALETSEAIIEFTAAGQKGEGGRRISEVVARAGFSSSIKD